MSHSAGYTAAAVSGWITEMAARLQDLCGADPDRAPVMLGIRTGGALVARELHRLLQLPDPCGELNISFYRDDFSRIGLHPHVGPSSIPFDVDARLVILVDDVLYSGRTVRAAMNEIFDFGRPERIVLAVLAERAGRELPIRADVIGHSVDLEPSQELKLGEDLSLQIRRRDSVAADNRAPDDSG